MPPNSQFGCTTYCTGQGDCPPNYIGDVVPINTAVLLQNLNNYASATCSTNLLNGYVGPQTTAGVRGGVSPCDGPTFGCDDGRGGFQYLFSPLSGDTSVIVSSSPTDTQHQYALKVDQDRNGKFVQNLNAESKFLYTSGTVEVDDYQDVPDSVWNVIPPVVPVPADFCAAKPGDQLRYGQWISLSNLKVDPQHAILHIDTPGFLDSVFYVGDSNDSSTLFRITDINGKVPCVPSGVVPQGCTGTIPSDCKEDPTVCDINGRCRNGGTPRCTGTDATGKRIWVCDTNCTPQSCTGCTESESCVWDSTQQLCICKAPAPTPVSFAFFKWAIVIIIVALLFVGVLLIFVKPTPPPDLQGSGQKAKPKGRKKIPVGVRNAVWNKWIGQDKASDYCATGCGTKITWQTYEVAHIESDKCGGDISLENLRPCCRSCNSSMGAENMRAWVKRFGLPGRADWGIPGYSALSITSNASTNTNGSKSQPEILYPATSLSEPVKPVALQPERTSQERRSSPEVSNLSVQDEPQEYSEPVPIGSVATTGSYCVENHHINLPPTPTTLTGDSQTTVEYEAPVFWNRFLLREEDDWKTKSLQQLNGRYTCKAKGCRFISGFIENMRRHILSTHEDTESSIPQTFTESPFFQNLQALRTAPKKTRPFICS